MSSKKRENFGSRFAVVMALAGSAVGLGNIWRFPFMVGEYGGAAFIILYIFFSIFVSLPIFLGESVIGRMSRQGTGKALATLAPGTGWKHLGVVTSLGCFIILSFYCVVGGWAMDYLFRASVNTLGAGDPAVATQLFGSIVSDTYEPILFALLFLVFTVSINILGVKNGIEKFNKAAMPALAVLIIVLACYSVTLPGARQGVDYLVRADFSKLSPRAIAYALGQSFFSMSIGVGVVLVYSSYMKKSERIVYSGFLTSLFDSLFALAAAFAVIPAVFSAGLEPEAGPSLVFETLPYVFAKMSGGSALIGRTVTILFFLAIFFAALTSSVSIMEGTVSHLMENRGISRRRSNFLIFIGAFAVAIICSLSFGPLKDVKLFGLSFFEVCDTLSSNYIMTLCALAFCIFSGWVLKKEDVRSELTNRGSLKAESRMFGVIYFLIKWVCPVMVAAVFVTNFII